MQVDSWRWAGVPCYLRTGKKLRCKAAEIAIEFRGSPHLPFESGNGGPGPNRLIIGIQPGERVQLHVSGKRPGEGLDIADLELDFDSGDDVERDAPEAYERLLGDALAGDQTLFTSSAEVEAQWTAVAPLLDARPGSGALRGGLGRAGGGIGAAGARRALVADAGGHRGLIGGRDRAVRG